MSRHYRIKWTQADEQELARAVKNFNAKISRLEKKLGANQRKALPEKMSVKQMKELIETRSDLKREINALRRFSRRGAEKIKTIPNTDYNVQITDWQLKEINRRLGIINRKRKKRHEDVLEMEVKSRGEGQGYTRGQLTMGRVAEVELRPRKVFTRSLTSPGLHKAYKNILKESQSTYWNKRELKMKENYINALKENFRINDIQEIVDAIEEMDFKDFYNIIMSEDPEFEFPYPPSEDEYRAYIEGLRAVWLPEKYSETEDMFKPDVPMTGERKLNKHSHAEKLKQQAKMKGR